MTASQSAKATPSQTTPKLSGDRLTFLEHLREFRKRIVFVVVVLLGGTILGYIWHEELVHFLVSPIGHQKLIYLTPGGGFDFIFKVSLYLGCALAIPVAIFQLFKYLSPLMGTHSRRMSFMVIIISVLLAVGGMAFGFFVALPGALNFLTSFGGEYIEASLTASSYLNFVIAYMLGLALLFQLPLILLFINRISGPFKPSQLFSSQRYVFLGVFILAAIITPTPDIANQAIVAGPVLAVYQLGVGMVLWQNRGQRLRRMKMPQASVAPSYEPSQVVTSIPSSIQPATVAAKQPVSGLEMVRPKPARATVDIVAVPHRVATRPAPKVPARQTPRPVRPPAAPMPRRASRNIDGVLQPGY